MAKTISAGGKSYSVSRNSNGSYTVSSGGKTSTVSGNSSLGRSIGSAYGSSGGGSGGSSSSSGGSYSSSNNNYSGGKNTVASSVNQPTVTKNINGTNFGFSKNADGSYNVYANGKYSTVGADSDMGKAAAGYLGSSGSTGTNKTSNTSSTGTDKYTSNSFQNYSNAMQHFISQGMTQDQAHEKAKTFLEDNPNYISKTSEEKKAEKYSPTTDEEDWNESIVPEWIDNYDEQPDTDEYDQSQLDYLQDIFNQGLNDVRNYVDDFISNNTKSQVVEDKSDVPSPSEAFDYNTYFNNNLVPKEDARENDSAGTNEYNPNAPLTDVTKYQDDAISALQNLGFLEPNTEAAESMPGAEEQTAPEALAEDTPEALVQGFDEKMDELGQMGGEQGLSPKDVARTYVDYRNRLAKYIKNNNIPDDQAAAMFDQLKNNEKLRNFLQANRR